MQRIYDQCTDDAGRLRDEGKGDPRLLAVAAQQGFDAKPTVVSDAEFDRLVETDGAEVLHRGLQGNDQGSASDLHAAAREGEYRPGYGIFGNGYYMAPDAAKAGQFSDGTSGSVARYALRPGAKTIDYDAIRDIQRTEVRVRFSTMSDAEGILISDPGVYAATLGYDAIRVAAGSSSHGGTMQHTEWIVLNRGALIAADGS